MKNMPAGTLMETTHYNRTVKVPYEGPLVEADIEAVQRFFKWLWDHMRGESGGLARFCHGRALTRWHLSAAGSAVKGIFETRQEAQEFFDRYARPKIFLAVNAELYVAMQLEISRNQGPPHALEIVSEHNGLVNMRMYKYVQLDCVKGKDGLRVHTWWPEHVYFDYARFLEDNRNWTMECSVVRENKMNRETQRKPFRKGNF